MVLGMVASYLTAYSSSSLIWVGWVLGIALTILIFLVVV